MITSAPFEQITRSLDRFDSIPVVPMILRPLLEQLDSPVEDVNLYRLVELVSFEPTIAARCLQIANSPLYARSRRVTSLRAAIVALGLKQLRDIVISSCLIHLMPRRHRKPDPMALWLHSFAVALVSRRMAQRLEWPDPERAYLAGLFHDFGAIANLVLFPDEMNTVVELAVAKQLSFMEAELRVLGFSHCDTGRLLGERWHFPEEFVVVMHRHHDASKVQGCAREIACLVSSSDTLCRSHGIGFGLAEQVNRDLTPTPEWQVVVHSGGSNPQRSFERFTAELDDYVGEVRRTAATLLQTQS